MNALEYFTFRRPTEADAQAVLDLIATCEIADYGDIHQSSSWRVMQPCPAAECIL